VRGRALLARASVGALAGLLAGMLAGIGARVAMRMVADGVADGVGVTTSFTWNGTLTIVGIGAVVGTPFGIVYDAILDRLPGPPRLRGLVFGALAFAIMGPIFFITNAEELFSQGRVVLFAVLFPVFGLALGGTHALSRRFAARLPVAVHATLAAVAGIGVVFTATGLALATLAAAGLVRM